MNMEIQERLLQLFEKEKIIPLKSNFDKTQLDNRTILISWMGEVCSQNQLSQKTLELAIRYVDFSFSGNPISLDYLQLLGFAAIFMAKKLYEPNQEIPIFEYIKSSDFNYSPDQLLQMEIAIASQLQWFLHLVTPSDYQSEFGIDERVDNTILYIMLRDKFVDCSCHEIFLLARYEIYKQFPYALDPQTESKLKSLTEVLSDDINQSYELQMSRERETQIQEEQEAQENQISKSRIQYSDDEEQPSTPLRTQKIKKNIKKISAK